ncbi:hypothetical protein M9980_11835 [Sphingomonas donggukensis]|uniref:Uncharacterized protein n=1 Tax=Sphingomonas donggukensis TaxID=2949093 RepID=A0ABY4TS45_9SPHN|nr:hypothetical protein [Sphingomonas donggukensis]URW75225.1 hypothetical protein M9980_11835 [Sphingomonas donggukensis]
MKIVDWLARTMMLVLASMATLALIGSLASVSNTNLRDAFPGAVERPEPGGAMESQPTAPAAPPSADPSSAQAGQPVRVAAPPPADRTDEIARWLKALTYAVLALAAFAAAGVVALARIAGHLGRVADR